IVESASCEKRAAAMELYIKNGAYHPMKWEVNYLQQTKGRRKLFCCVGYRIIDDERLKKLNLLAEKYRQLIMQGLTGIIFHDKQGELIATNEQTARLFNTTLENLYQLKDIRTLWSSGWEISNEEGEPALFEDTPFMRALKTQKPEEATLKIRLSSGQQRWIRFNSQPLPNELADNEDCYILTNIIDVTNEKELAERVDEKNALSNAFIRQTPNLGWVVDEESKLMMGSTAFFQHFGLNEKESLNKSMLNLVPSFVYKALYAKHIEVFEKGVPLKVVEKVKL